MNKGTEKVIIKETIRRDFGGYDNAESKEQILTFLVIDKILSGLIKQDITPTIAIQYFDQWINLYISGDYKLEFSEDSREVTCNFMVNSKAEPNKHLLLSIEYINKLSFGRSIIESYINKIEDINQAESDENNEIQEHYLDLASKIWNYLMIFQIIGLYLEEQFTKCHEIINSVSMEIDENQLKLLILIISINVDIINGRGADFVEGLQIFQESNLKEDEFLDFKSVLYQIVGTYLEYRPNGIKGVLADKSLPDAEKFWFLFSMSLSPHLGNNANIMYHYLKLAENYLGGDIHNVVLLCEEYNEQGYWKDALHLIHKTEQKKGKNPFLDASKARTLIGANKYQEAFEVLDKVSEDINEENIDLMVMKGDCLITAGKRQEGIDILERVLEIKPDYADALVVLGIYNFMEVKNYRKALRYLLAAEKQGELLPEVYDILADIYEDLGLMKKSQEYRNEAISRLAVFD